MSIFDIYADVSISETVQDRSKLLLTTNRNMYTRFRLVPKSMTLNDPWARFKVIYSLNAAKMAKYSLVLTPTPCRVAGCIISIRPRYSCNGALTYLFFFTYLLTYTVGSGNIKPAISPKRLKIERKLLLTAYIKSDTGFRLPPKCMTLNDLCARFKVIDSLKPQKWRNTA